MDHQRLISILESEDVLSVGQILDRFGLKDNDTNRRNLRQFIEDAIKVHFIPVGSTPKGLFLCKTSRQLDEAIHHLNAVESSYRQRASALHHAFTKDRKETEATDQSNDRPQAG